MYTSNSLSIPQFSESLVKLTHPVYFHISSIEGTLFIKDAGVWQTGIGYSLSYQYFLRFSFGGRDETLRKTGQ
jgi:hypothetical protein